MRTGYAGQPAGLGDQWMGRGCACADSHATGSPNWANTWNRWTASCERKTDRSATRRMVPSVSGARAGSRTRCHWEIVRGVACRARAGARPEDRTRRCSVIHHWASSDACSAPAVTAFLRRRATAMATPFQSSVADSTLVSEQ